MIIILKNRKFLKGLLVAYVVHVSFTNSNTFLYITSTSGHLKFCCSAGLFNFKGKQKKARITVLNSFFNVLKQMKISLLKNKPIAIHLNNVGFYKYFIINNLKQYFFIRIIKSYERYSYNGCRKKKKIKKKQKFKRR